MEWEGKTENIYSCINYIKSMNSCLERILDGNKKFRSKIDKKILERLKSGQNPFAVVVACSDSRVPVEMILGCENPGEIFVIRVAGNVVDDLAVEASLEYAVHHLRVPLVLIMGHTNCGAVTACLEGSETSGKLCEFLEKMRKEIKEDDVNKAVIENVKIQIERLENNEIIKEALDKNSVEIIGCVYDIETGIIKLL